MASVYELDVSITLDDIGWHFMNWHDLTLAEETEMGLRELGAEEHAAAFSEALRLARPVWEFFGEPDFRERYLDSPIDALLAPINERLWTLQGLRDAPGRTILSYWSPYARKYPDRVGANDA